VSDRISPLDQILQRSFPLLILGMMAIDRPPEIDTKKSKIGSNAAWLSVLTFKLTAPGEPGLHQMSHHDRWIDEGYETRNTFRVEVTAEPLKLGG
jgi:hypothetical protein